MIGGGPNSGSPAQQSVEFWSAADPEQASCVLHDYPRAIGNGLTADLVSGHLIACYHDSCDIYLEGSWKHLQDTTVSRERHSSAKTTDAVFLIGGEFSNTNEWIPVDGSAAYQGQFTVRHGQDHCTVQISADAIVVTGGHDSYNYVTEYQLADGNESPLSSLERARFQHACGVYQDTDSNQVRKALQCAQNSVMFNFKMLYKFEILGCFRILN